MLCSYCCCGPVCALVCLFIKMPRNPRKHVNSKSVQANGHLNDFRLNTNFIGGKYCNDSELTKKRKIKIFCSINDIILFSKNGFTGQKKK